MKHTNNFVKNIKKTYKNKLAAVFMIAAGVLDVVLDKDITLLVFMAMIAIPMFLAKKDWFYTPED